MLKDVRKIKGLQSQLSALEGDVSALKIEIDNKQKDYKNKLDMIKSIKNEIESLSKTKDIKISEHAIIRYLERVKGLNINDIEKEIINEEIVKMVNALGGNGKYPNKDFSVVMKDFTVTTVVNKQK